MPHGAYFVILSSILLGSRINVGNTTLLKSAPGRSCEMICDKTAADHQLRVFPRSLLGVRTIALIGLDNCGVVVGTAGTVALVHRRSIACFAAQVSIMSRSSQLYNLDHCYPRLYTAVNVQEKAHILAAEVRRDRTCAVKPCISAIPRQ